MAQPPTIVQLVPSLETGGAERTAVDVAAALRREGWGAVVASQGGRLVGALEEAGATHVLLPLDTKNPLAIWRNAARIEATAREHGAALIHARSRGPAWSGLIAARRAGLPFVTTYHGAYNQRGRLKGLYNSVMARGDAVIANSHWTKALIEARHPFARGRIEAIARGTDFGDFDADAIDPARVARQREAWGVDGGRRVVLHLARLTGWKGQTVLIEAARRMRERGTLPEDVTVVLAGDAQGRDAYVRHLREAVAAGGLADRVLLPGHSDDPAAAMAAAAVAIVASTEPEAFGRAAVEAQAMGVPVIVTRLGAVEETVLAEPEVEAARASGIKVAPGDAAALADALERLLAMPRPALSAMGRNGRDHVRARFSLDVMSDATIALYRRVLGEGPA